MTVAAQRRGFLARLFGWEDDRVDTVIEQARETVATEAEHPAGARPRAGAAGDAGPAAGAGAGARARARARSPSRSPSRRADERRDQQVLEHVLDSLGQAHHRPFSRA